MYSRADDLLTSLERNDPGSSSTSPSRFPRIFVENQPFSPNRRDFNPGAISVFINVWPLLKSLPPTGTFIFLASSKSAGISVVMWGAPFAYGTPDLRAAYAYIWLGEISGSLFCKPHSKSFRLACTAAGWR